MVVLGSVEAGKSSMVQSLIAGSAVLVNIEDRTQVVNWREWNISEDDMVHIYDQGGHMIYSITRMHFIYQNTVSSS